MKKIAIIGGGAAGCAAAWALHKTHDVTVYEAESYLGGHAYSHELEVNGESVSIDMGVEFFHERISPNLCAMLQKFDIGTYVAPLSFKAFHPKNPTIEYWSNCEISGNIKDQLYDEMNQFHLDMNSVIQEHASSLKGLSMKEYLDQKKYSDTFKHQVLLPMMTTFSGCKAPSLDYTLMYIALSFNMNLLSFHVPCQWRKAKGGIQQYYKKMSEALKDRVRLNTKVISVERKNNMSYVTLSDNTVHLFDKVIFACQAEIVKKIIKKIRKIQYDILNSFEYVEVQSTLHSDDSLLASQKDSKEYCQFVLSNECHDAFTGTLTRINNRLYPYRHIQKPLLVSFDNRDEIDPNKIIHCKNWKLPKLRPIDFVSKRKISFIQGIDDFWYCGTDYSVTGHEGAIVSGFIIAEHLGGIYPFNNNYMARTQFDMIKGLMGVHSTTQKIIHKFSRIVFSVVQRFNLHKRFTGEILNQILF